MKIYFKDKKLEKLCNNPVKLVKTMGAIRAEKLQQRLDDLDTALHLKILVTYQGITMNL